MAKGTPYVVVHGGVHKTATSHIQALLQRNAGRLGKRGVHYIHHRDTRKDYTYPCQLNGYAKIGLGYRTKVSDKEMKKRAKAFFRKVKSGPGERIILSDENMPGHCGQCVRKGALYHRRDVLLPIFADHIPYPVREVHLALRNYADFFASAYIEFLRSASGEHVFSDIQMKRAVLSHLPSWTGYVGLVRDCFPGARLMLWRHEDFGALSGQVIAGLIGPGIDPGSLVSPKRERGRPSASHRAVQEILSEAERTGGAAAMARRVEIQEKYPRGPDWPAYDPWTAAERAHLTGLYERDLAEIRRQLEVEFLEPQTS